MISLRPHEPSDLTALIDLAIRAWTDVEATVDTILGSPLDRLATPSWQTHHTAMVTEACESPVVSVVVAEDSDDTIKGFVAYTIHSETAAMSDYGEITLIAVDPSVRRLGVGRRLLDNAVTDLKAQGAPVIMVSTGGDDGHTPARGLFGSAGFTRLPLAQYWLPGADQPPTS